MSTSDHNSQTPSSDRSSPAARREITDIADLIQDLTDRAIGSDSPAHLLAKAFPVLFRCLPFDAGVAVMLEQNLDLYISTRQDAETLVSEDLITRIRATLQELIPVSFASTDVVVVSELHDLAPRKTGSPSLEHEAYVLLQVEHRIAGVLALFRGEEPFDVEHKQLLQIFSTQVSLLMSHMHARERIMNLAETDDLTGIKNKRYFRRHLPQEMERARIYNLPLSLLIVDLDDFKVINDNYGHPTGDVVLSELCGAIRETLRHPDVFARFGGDEFAIVLPHTDTDGACAVAERILERVRAMSIPTDDAQPIRCTVSVGVAPFRPADLLSDDLVRRADDCLYAAKRAGKDRYVTATE